MYKSKKQNYPGLYGTFKKIDNQNLPKDQEVDQTQVEPDQLADYGTDDDFQDLDKLIHNLKKKAKSSSSQEQESVPSKTQRARSEESSDEISIEEELIQLKKAKSFFSSKSRGQSLSASPVVSDDQSSDTDIFTDSSYLDSLEEDLFVEKKMGRQPMEKVESIEEIENLTSELMYLLQASPLTKRARFVETKLFSDLLSELETMKEEG